VELVDGFLQAASPLAITAIPRGSPARRIRRCHFICIIGGRLPGPVAPARARKVLADTGRESKYGRLVSSKGRPYRTLVVEGFEVLVGRGDEDNDHLTFDVAEPKDLWLHVAGGTAGSHVVVRNPDDVEVPRSVVEVAAAAAAWYSKARSARSVEVHVCRASDVRKPRGAPAGLVELARYKSVRVRPALPSD
jgi:predicted ribosome quality control (RQC) complex YloA/Tae2 family protein